MFSNLIDSKFRENYEGKMGTEERHAIHRDNRPNQSRSCSESHSTRETPNVRQTNLAHGISLALNAPLITSFTFLTLIVAHRTANPFFQERAEANLSSERWLAIL